MSAPRVVADQAATRRFQVEPAPIGQRSCEAEGRSGRGVPLTDVGDPHDVESTGVYHPPNGRRVPKERIDVAS